jgi:ubiquinol-cytochrome c reductase cytochrome c subunit
MMRASGLLSLLVLALAVLAGAHVASAQGTAPPPGDPKLGQALWMRDGCYECHGTVAQGSGARTGGTGPMLAPKPLPFVVILSQLRRPINVMPPYSTAILSDRDAASIYAFLQSIPQEKSASSIPALSGYLRK